MYLYRLFQKRIGLSFTEFSMMQKQLFWVHCRFLVDSNFHPGKKRKHHLKNTTII